MRILSIVGAAMALFVTSLSLSCHADLPRPEHPRPDCQRESWLNLNVSKLGRDLRRISDKIAASGEKPLTRRELEREIANRRSGNF